MRKSSLLLLVAIYLLAIFFGASARTSPEGFLPYTILYLSVFFSVSIAPIIVDALLKRQRFTLRILLLTGRGFDERSEYIFNIVVKILFTVSLGFVSYSIISLFLFLSTELFILAMISVGLVGALLFVLMFRHKFVIVSRKENTEVELPLLMIMMYALSSLGLSLYDMVENISRSASLTAWAKEMRLLKRIMQIGNTSLYTAFSLVMNIHPSKTVRETFSRIAYVGKTVGDVRNVVMRLFKIIYEKYVRELKSIEPKISIITMSLVISIFLFVTTESMVSTFGAFDPNLLVSGTGLLTLAVAIFVLISNVAVYPRIMELLIPTEERLLVLFLYGASGSLLALLLLEIIEEKTYFGLSPQMLALLSAIPLIPATIVSAREEHRARIEVKFMNIVTDAAEASESTGTSLISSIKKLALERGTSYMDLAKNIENTYYSAFLRNVTVLKRRTLLTRSYFETIMLLIAKGVPAKVVADVSKMYEELATIWSGISKKALGLFFLAVGMAVASFVITTMYYSVFDTLLKSMPSNSFIMSLSGLEIFKNPSIVKVIYKMGAVYLVSNQAIVFAVGRSRYGNIISSAPLMLIYSIIIAAFLFVLPPPFV